VHVQVEYVQQRAISAPGGEPIFFNFEMDKLSKGLAGRCC
jgi:hypothetical protein